ncbi:hypothetical protein AFL01nite_04920 [Aeromicrobium flavum]|uniref:Uncharacterized protein n=1 Tax=Aeromicrobium flavum TaxID=416568 RepID=A0A512HRT5_9ACTN|nr:hypothetical protein [Aeromicrobium flavum]GEO88165.1 hypothetical protein AFL01nite_04920 [Aeromicrobium flavum]
MNHAQRPDFVLKPNPLIGVDDIRLEVHPDLLAELKQELEAADIEHGEALERSATVTFGIVILFGIFQTNAVGQLATLFEKIAHRHDGKSMRVKVGDVEIDLAGESFDTMAKKLDEQLPKLQEQNVEMKKHWDESVARIDAEMDELGYSDLPKKGGALDND